MSLELTWLGQAGFALRAGPAGLVLVDPYLSDSLAEKYRGARFPHRRMVPPPVAPDALPPVAAVLCSHRHTDHMDPGTLIPVLAGSPGCLVLAPDAEREEALARGVPEDRLIGVDAGDELEPVPGLGVRVVPAAHETLERDERGRHRFVGYVLDLGGVRLYHSGDCVPYEGQAELLRPLGIDLALLPVNGRDAGRLAGGVPGNFTFGEAVDLCARAGIGALVPHHFGMFDFNTVDPATFDVAGAAARGVRVTVPEHGGTVPA